MNNNAIEQRIKPTQPPKMLELLSKDIANIVYQLLFRDRFRVVLLQYEMCTTPSELFPGGVVYKKMGYNYRNLNRISSRKLIYNVHGKSVGNLPDNY